MLVHIQILASETKVWQHDGDKRKKPTSLKLFALRVAARAHLEVNRNTGKPRETNSGTHAACMNALT